MGQTVTRFGLALAVILAACLPSLRETAYPGVTVSEGCLNRDGLGRCRDSCSRKYDDESARIGGATLAEVRRRGLLVAPQSTPKAPGGYTGRLWTPTLLDSTPVVKVPQHKAPASPAGVTHQPIAICIIDKAPPITCGGIPVYGCAVPLRDRLPVWVAGQHPQWKRTLVHEILCSLAYVGQMAGWPTAEAEVIKRSDYREIIDVVVPPNP